jgi:hypothetical protein
MTSWYTASHQLVIGRRSKWVQHGPSFPGDQQGGPAWVQPVREDGNYTSLYVPYTFSLGHWGQLTARQIVYTTLQHDSG